MKNVSHNKNWNRVTVKVHVDTPLAPLIKIKNDDKSDQDYVKIKMIRYLMSQN